MSRRAIQLLTDLPTSLILSYDNLRRRSRTGFYMLASQRILVQFLGFTKILEKTEHRRYLGCGESQAYSLSLELRVERTWGSLDVICKMEATFFVVHSAVITIRESFLSWVTSIIWDVLLLFYYTHLMATNGH